MIALVAHSQTLFPPDDLTYFEEARDAIVSAVAAAESNESVVSHIPSRFLSYFDRIGRSLHEGEAVEFARGSSGIARLTQQTRRTLVEASQANEFTEETVLRGGIPEVDQDDLSFEVQLADGRKIPAPMAPEHTETILDAFNGYTQGVRVSLSGVGRFNRRDRLLRIDTVEHLSMIDALDIHARIDEIRILKAGWLDGAGRVPSENWLNWFCKSYVDGVPEELALPFIYPTVEGGLQLEWTEGDWEATLEIDGDSRRADWHAMNLRDHSDDEAVLELAAEPGWRELAQRVRGVLGVAT